MIYQDSFSIDTTGRGTIDITTELREIVNKADVDKALCHIFTNHTSASLIMCTNSDPNVAKDLETFMLRLVPDGSLEFLHDKKGPDDMSSHIRTVLTHNDLSIPVSGGKLLLNEWQAIYLWEHTLHPHNRKITVSIF